MEPVEPVQRNIYQSNTYRKDLSWSYFDNEPRVQEKQQVKDQQSCIFQQFQVATRGTSPDVTTVFHTWAYGRFIEIQSSLRRKKLHRTNQGSNFLGGSFSNRDNIKVESNLQEEVNPSILKDDFSSRTDPSIDVSISIAPTLLNRSKKTSWVFPALKSTKLFLSPVYSFL